MFDHVVFGVSDYASSKAFFLAALEPLGIADVLEGPLGLELSSVRMDTTSKWFATNPLPNRAMVTST